jgi:hypothetical protein
VGRYNTRETIRESSPAINLVFFICILIFKGWNMNNKVESFFTWKCKPDESIEDKNKSNKIISKWEKTDVLYSFVGIYQIGIYVYNPDLCRRTNCVIKSKDSKSGYFDVKYLTEIVDGKPRYQKFEELNKKIEESRFIEVIDSPGNIIPIWPGGNVDRGTKAYCFDIPDIYFHNCQRWFLALQLIYPNAYLTGIINNEFSKDTKSFLDEMCENKDKYERFLKHIVDIIENRNKYLCCDKLKDN